MGTINPRTVGINNRPAQSAPQPTPSATTGGAGPFPVPVTPNDSFVSSNPLGAAFSNPLGASLPLAMVIKATPLQVLAGVENLASGADSDGNPLFSRQDLIDLSAGKGRFAGASDTQVAAAKTVLEDQGLETALDQANADGNNFQSENEDDWYNLKALKEHPDSIAAVAVFNENPSAAVAPEAPQAPAPAAADKPEEEPASASE